MTQPLNRVLAERWFFHSTPLALDTETIWIRDLQGLADALLYFGKSCLRIKHLAIFTHGDAGVAFFETKASFQGLRQDDLSRLAQYSCALAPGATVDFGGCLIGQGCKGTAFMMEIAKSLLAKGGRVIANSTYSSTFLPGIVPHHSLDLTQYVFERVAGEDKGRWRGNASGCDVGISKLRISKLARECRDDSGEGCRTKVYADCSAALEWAKTAMPSVESLSAENLKDLSTLYKWEDYLEYIRPLAAHCQVESAMAELVMKKASCVQEVAEGPGRRAR